MAYSTGWEREVDGNHTGPASIALEDGMSK